jgi:hypothetical protein
VSMFSSRWHLDGYVLKRGGYTGEVVDA